MSPRGGMGQRGLLTGRGQAGPVLQSHPMTACQYDDTQIGALSLKRVPPHRRAPDGRDPCAVSSHLPQRDVLDPFSGSGATLPAAWKPAAPGG